MRHSLLLLLLAVVLVPAASAVDLRHNISPFPSISPNRQSPGGTVTVNGSVAVSGHISEVSNQNWQIRFYLSTDGNITTSDTFLGTKNMTGYIPGNTISFTKQVTVPNSVPLGSNRFIGWIIDAGNDVAESIETNNRGAVTDTLEVAALPNWTTFDPTIESRSGTNGGLPWIQQGEFYKIIYKFQNVGDAWGAGGKVRFYLSADTVLNTSQDTLLVDFDAGIWDWGTPIETDQMRVAAPGSVQTPFDEIVYEQEVFRFTAPNMPAGNYHLIWKVDADNAVAEIDESDNAGIYPTQVKVTGRCNLLDGGGHFISRNQVGAGDVLTAKARIANHGNYQSRTTRVDFYMLSSPDLNINNHFSPQPDRKIGSAVLPPIPAAGSRLIEVDLTIPDTLPSGEGFYYLGWDIDPRRYQFGGEWTDDPVGGLNVEIEEANDNMVINQVPINYVDNRPLPNLDFETGSASVSATEVVAGGTVTAAMRILNEGNVSSGVFRIRYLLNDSFLFYGEELKSTSYAPLAAGGARWLNVDLEIPLSTEPGDYVIHAEVDPDDTIVELQENDNRISVPTMITVTEPPGLADLRKQGFTGDLSARDVMSGDIVTATAIIENGRAQAAHAFAVSIVASADTEFSLADDILLAVTSVGTMQGYATHDFSYDFTVPGSLPSGQWKVGAILDSAELVPETSEDNNEIYLGLLDVTATGEPDGMPTPTMAIDGDSGAMTLTIPSGGAGYVYYVEASTDLKNWEIVQAGLTGDTQVSFTADYADTADYDARFYRFVRAAE